MTIREYAKSKGFKIVGKLKRIADARYGFYGHYPVWIDEAGNEYHVQDNGVTSPITIVTYDGGIL